jgi:glutamine amidotransferase
MKVAIVNYGMGNLGSVQRALLDLGASAFIADQPAQMSGAQRVVLPGVGAFSEGMSRLREGGWIESLQRVVHEGRPMLGICLGMQMLATTGDEGGRTDGLNLVPGRIRRLDQLGCTLRVPHVGWNEVLVVRQDPLFEQIPSRSDFYFVHSYAFVADATDAVVAVTDYAVAVTAAVHHRNIFGTQFHPEKSSRAGRQLLRNFMEYAPC